MCFWREETQTDLFSVFRARTNSEHDLGSNKIGLMDYR
jgi:hypothetical protein